MAFGTLSLKDTTENTQSVPAFAVVTSMLIVVEFSGMTLKFTSLHHNSCCISKWLNFSLSNPFNPCGIFPCNLS